ncbi:MAG: hypothetical protein H6832_00305 [Planctomycetes bacterium]|nr:hypothetical protein [Planctomycetota bacterium]MCB9916824.1 hypothetical protein [Planctomycetota bacterium]
MSTLIRRAEQPLQASKSVPTLAIVLTCAIALALVSLASGLSGQDTGKDDAAQIEKNAIVHFASLLYREAGTNEMVSVAAADLEKIQLVRPVQGGGSDYWVELFYRGGDYVLQRVNRLVFLRRDGGAQQMKLPVNLVRADRMGFPFVN